MAMRVARILRAALSGAFFLAYGVFTLASAPILVLPVWPRKTFRALIRFFYKAFVACARATALFSVEADAKTRETLASLHGAIVVTNHISLIDIVVLVALLPDATAIAKPAVLRNPFLSIVARRMFIVNTGDVPALAASAASHLADGVNVVIFPQGTRGGDTLHRGAARLALATRTAIFPFRLDYDPPVLAKGQPWWDVGCRKIRISIEARGRILPSAPDSHAEAKRLTAAIAAAIAP